MNGDSFKRCRICGKKIGIITQGIYRKVVVDVDPVEVIADAGGMTFIRIDGSKVTAREATRFDDNALEAEWAYRPHRRSCEVRYEM